MQSATTFKVAMASLANKTISVVDARVMDHCELLIQQNARVSLLLHLDDRDMADLMSGKQVTLEDLLLKKVV
ncbi:MAG: hypothetical protein E6R04_09355 [Spirochaetes bacterium]|nr:MAG: hypothetical protein E6R04_09355 [Spirochaetota bacterium]